MKNSGQALIEILVALTVMLLVATAFVTLGVVTVRNSSFSQNKTRATQLAQEGIEAVIAIRDQNGPIQNFTATLWQGLYSSSMSCPQTADLTQPCGNDFILQEPSLCPPTAGPTPVPQRCISNSTSSHTASVWQVSANTAFSRKVRITDTADLAEANTVRDVNVFVWWTDSQGLHKAVVTRKVHRNRLTDLMYSTPAYGTPAGPTSTPIPTVNPTPTPTPTPGPVTFDVASSIPPGTCANCMWNHTIGSGSNRLIVVGVSTHATVGVTSVSYNGLSLFKLSTDAIGTDTRSEIWHRTDAWGLPVAGTYSVSVNLTFAADMMAGATSWSNVSQTTPFGTAARALASPCSVNLTSTANEFVFDTIAVCTGPCGAGTPSANAGQTQRWNGDAGNTSGSASTKPGASSVTMGWGVGTNSCTLLAVPIRPLP